MTAHERQQRELYRIADADEEGIKATLAELEAAGLQGSPEYQEQEHSLNEVRKIKESIMRQIFAASWPGFGAAGEAIADKAVRAPGVAQQIYTDLNARQFEGTIEVYDAEWIGGIGPGNVLNVANAFPDWATMNAAVREVTWKFGMGGTSASPGVRGTIRIGPNKKLTPKDIMDRARAWRLRFASFALYGGSVGITGQIGSPAGSVQFPDTTDATIPGQTPPNPHISVTGNSQQPANPGEAAVYHAPAIPTQPADPDTNDYFTESSIIQKDTSNNQAIWGNAILVSDINGKDPNTNTPGGYADAGLHICKRDDGGNVINPPPTGKLNNVDSYVDGNGNPIGAVGGEILLLLSQLAGQQAQFRGVIGCDPVTQAKKYSLMLCTPWLDSPIPGIKYS